MNSFAIVPAAGFSRRMGSHKLLLPWESGTVIDATLRRWKKSRVHTIVVVVRADDEPLMGRCLAHDVDVVPLATRPPHMKDSVIAALQSIQQKHAPSAHDAWLLAPADMPRLSPEVVDQLLSEAATAPEKILKPSYDGRHGHPVLFSWSLKDAVMNLAVDQGIDTITRSHSVRIVPCNRASILDDMNTPAEYESLRGAQESNFNQ